MNEEKLAIAAVAIALGFIVAKIHSITYLNGCVDALRGAREAAQTA